MLVTKVLSSALYLLPFALGVLSAPVESLKDASLKDVKVIKREAPPLPSIDEIKQQLSVGKDTSLFYSGPGGYNRKARDWAKKKKNGYKILAQNWKDASWQDKWQNDENASVKFFDLASTAMAELSAGIVYVMLPSDTKGTNWQSDTVWDRAEWPYLRMEKGKENPNVEKIIRVNPNNEDEETIYSKSSSSSAPPAKLSSCVGTPTSAPSAQRDYVRDTIYNKYCPFMSSGAIGGGAITINKKQPYGPVGYYAGPDGTPDAANTLWLSISLVDSPSCASGFQVDKAICEDMLSIALDGCNTDSTDKKYGGSVTAGCGIYDMQLRSGHDDTPPKGFSAEHGA